MKYNEKLANSYQDELKALENKDYITDLIPSAFFRRPDFQVIQSKFLNYSYFGDLETADIYTQELFEEMKEKNIKRLEKNTKIVSSPLSTIFKPNNKPEFVKKTFNPKTHSFEPYDNTLDSTSIEINPRGFVMDIQDRKNFKEYIFMVKPNMVSFIEMSVDLRLSKDNYTRTIEDTFVASKDGKVSHYCDDNLKDYLIENEMK